MITNFSKYALVAFVFFSNQTIAASSQQDIYQRYITFKNDFSFPIYPVIQVPADLCDGASQKGVRRILINSAGEQGLLPGQTMTVLIPREKKTVINKGKEEVRACWYASGRIYIFAVDIHQFENNMMKLDPNNKDMTTKYDDPAHPKEMINCFQGTMDNKGANGNCYSGVAKNSFAADVPAQLAEYTFDSDGGKPNNDPDTGIPMADIDVSNVDDLYLPVAASVYNHGATGYMGSGMPLDLFKTRVNEFLLEKNKLIWPVYSAFLEQNWSQNAFASLMPDVLGGAKGQSILMHMPAGYNTINNTLGRPLSALYNTANGTDDVKYLISNVAYDKNTGIPSNPLVQQYLDRWMAWINGNPCANLDALKWPDNITKQFDKPNFCKKFKENVVFVWNHFLNDPKEGFYGNQGVYKNPKLNGKNSLAFYSDCGLYDVDNAPNKMPPNDDNLRNSCVIQHIVGYNSETLTGELPGRIQAVLRGVAYDPKDGSQQYQFDPFLLFAAPYDSLFNLVPFTRFIHSTTDGIGAVAYSFSIDDKYGNFRDASSGFIVNAGGISALENKTPFDPYQQYKVNWGYNSDDKESNNWVKADICGVPLNVINSPGNHSMSMPITDNGSFKPCDIKFTDAKGDTLVFKFFLEKKSVVDTYTGATVNVFGLRTGNQHSGDPKITSNLDTKDIKYCEQNSSQLVRNLCSSTTVSAAWAIDPLARDIIYMGLKFEDMPRVYVNIPVAPTISPNMVYWPDSTIVTSSVDKNDPKKVTFTWTPAISVAKHSLLYMFVFSDGSPAQCVGNDGRGVPDTACTVVVPPGKRVEYKLLAIDYISHPVQQAEYMGVFNANSR